MTRPNINNYTFPKYETEIEQYVSYTEDLNEYCDKLEAALNKTFKRLLKINKCVCPSDDIGCTTKGCVACWRKWSMDNA